MTLCLYSYGVKHWRWLIWYDEVWGCPYPRGEVRSHTPHGEDNLFLKACLIFVIARVIAFPEFLQIPLVEQI